MHAIYKIFIYFVDSFSLELLLVCFSPLDISSSLINSIDMTKDKKSVQQEEPMDTSVNNGDENGAEGPSYEDKFKYMNAMASPVAPKKLAKKVFKCVKQATKQKNYVRLGLRETQKYIRRGEKGLVVFAGNVTPIDIYSHMPVVCGKTHEIV